MGCSWEEVGKERIDSRAAVAGEIDGGLGGEGRERRRRKAAGTVDTLTAEEEQRSRIAAAAVAGTRPERVGNSVSRFDLLAEVSNPRRRREVEERSGREVEATVAEASFCSSTTTTIEEEKEGRAATKDSIPAAVAGKEEERRTAAVAEDWENSSEEVRRDPTSCSSRTSEVDRMRGPGIGP